MTSRASGLVVQQLESVTAALRQLDGVVHIRSALQKDVYPLTVEDGVSGASMCFSGVDAAAALTHALRTSPLGVLSTFAPTPTSAAVGATSLPPLSASRIAANAARMCGDLVSELDLDVGDALHHLQRAVGRVREAAGDCAAKASEISLLALAPPPVPAGRAGGNSGSRGGGGGSGSTGRGGAGGAPTAFDASAAFEQWHEGAWTEAHLHAAARRLSDLAATLEDVLAALRWVVTTSGSTDVNDTGAAERQAQAAAGAGLLEVCDVSTIAPVSGSSGDHLRIAELGLTTAHTGENHSSDPAGQMRQASHAAMQRAAGLRILARHREAIDGDDGAPAGAVLTPRTAVASFLNYVEITRAEAV